MNINDDTKLDAAIEEQYSSQHRSKVIVFLRQLSCYLINLALLIGCHVLIVSMLIALFQQHWQANSLPFWQLVREHLFEQNVICLGIILMLINLTTLNRS